MLILTRREGGSIIIGDDIEVRVLQLKGNQVAIGLAAPRDIAIHRKEIYQKIQEERAQATANGDGNE